jgi:predicted dithiol-disulfide oxidoreductase (DUF899 family)
MTRHTVASRGRWLVEREALLAREKEHTRRGDELARQRMALPWVRIEREYTLQTEDGPASLPQLFAGRSQLLLYHFMFGPEYEAGCPVNSSIADALDGLLPHLAARDVTLMLVSGAPIEKLLAYRERMGWDLPWASSYGTAFDLEIGFSSTEEQIREWLSSPRSAALPAIARRNAEACGTDLAGYMTEGFGFTAMALQDGAVHQTYSTTGRGVEFLMPYYGVLDRAPRGRAEGPDAWQLWIQRRDEYRASGVRG